MRVVVLMALCSAALLANVNNLQRLYDQQKYRDVIVQAKKAKGDYTKPKLHLIWARSAKALGKNVEAMSAYERVLIFQPNNEEAKKELTALYRVLGKKKLLQELMGSTTSSEQKSEEKSHPYWDAKLTLATGYDTNVNVQNQVENLDLFYGTSDHSNKIGSSFVLAQMHLHYTKKFATHFYLTSSLDGYYKMLAKESDYSIYLNTFKAEAGYYKGDLNVHIPLYYTALHYLGEDYMRVTSINPQIDYRLGKQWTMSLHTKFEKREFQSNPDRDDVSATVGSTLFYQWGKNYFLIDAEYQNYTSNSDSYQKFTNKTLFTLVGAMEYRLSSDLKLNGSYRVSWSEFDDDLGTSTTGVEEGQRSDVYNQLNLRLTKAMSKHCSLFIDNEYAINNTKYVPSDYTKNTLMVGINYSY